MLIILTNSEDSTVDFVIDKLNQNRIVFYRINTDEIISHLKFKYSSSDCLLFGKDNFTISAHEVTTIWYRRPEPIKFNGYDEAVKKWVSGEWTSALEGWLSHVDIGKWINHPSNIANANSKIEQITRAKQIGFCVPDTLMTYDLQEVIGFWNKYHHKLIAKPILTGYVEAEKSEDDSIIYTTEITEADLSNEQIFLNCPTLFQERIEKGYDVRITVFDEAITAVKMKRGMSCPKIG